MSYLNQELTRSSGIHIEPNEILESPSSLKERTGSTAKPACFKRFIRWFSLNITGPTGFTQKIDFNSRSK